jgi:SpoVK/Ycf46/Vps4 family AAA+-type ATPase
MGDGSDKGGSSSVHERVLTQLLVELDGVEDLQGVVVIGATNRPDILDPALLRPGRLDRMVYIGPPNEQDRADIIRLQFQKLPAGNDIDIVDLVKRSEGMSGAEVVSLCREASMFAVVEDPVHADRVMLRHFNQAFQVVKARTTRDIQEYYEKFLRSSE